MLLFIINPSAGNVAFAFLIPLVLGSAALVVIFLLIRQAFKFGAPTPLGATTIVSGNVVRRAALVSDILPPALPRAEPYREPKRILSIEEKLEHIDWFQFEKVVAMLYSARACKVERRGGANPDGGIDLIVQSQSGPFAVQCKYWKACEVGVRQVREFLGALQDARILKGVIVSIKGFTNPARELAARHNIELIGKSNLLEMLNDARFTPHIREINAIMNSDEKRCPRCERQMAKRTSSKDGNKFWGCSGYPRCRYTMAIS